MTDQFRKMLLSRFVSVMLFLVISAFSVVSPAQAQSSLTNVGFEPSYGTVNLSGGGATVSGVIANGWKDNTWGTLTTSYSQDTTQPHSGTSDQAINISSYTSGAMEMVEPISVTPLKTYSATIWVRGSCPSGVSFSAMANASPWTQYGSTTFIPSATWTQYTMTFTAPANDTVYFMIEAAGPGTIYVDDAQLMALTNPTQNPGFETLYTPVTSSGGATLSGSIANGWSDNSAASTVNVTYGKDTSSPHGGTTDQVVTTNSVTTGTWQAGQTEAVTAGSTYTATIWVKGSNSGGMSLFVQQSTSPYTKYAVTAFTPTGDWTQYSVSFTASVTENIIVGLLSTHSGVMYLDDAQFSGYPNILTNPGFETPYNTVTSTGTATRTGVIANGWFDNSGGTTINETYSQDTSSPHGGTSDQKVVINSLSGNWQYIQPKPVTAGHTYQATIWVKGTNTSGLTFFLQKGASPWTSYVSTTFVPVAGWTQYALTFTAATTENIDVILSTYGTGTMYIDDASFTDCPNLALNAEFESPYNAVAAGNVTGIVASNWYDNTSWNSSCTIAYAQDTTTFHSGASSQKIAVATGYSQLQQNTTFVQGRNTASIWVKASAPTWVSLGLALKYSPYTNFATTTYRATTTWTQISVTGYTPAANGIILFVTNVASPATTVWVDDSTLTFQGVSPSARTISTPITAIPLTYFGQHPASAKIVSGTMVGWPTVTFGVARSHDTMPKWRNIETSRGVYDWTSLDLYLNTALANSQKVVYTFSQTPSWATSDMSLDLYGNVGGNGVPSNMVYWTEFVTALVQRYGPLHKIMGYEIWNEPTSGFWNGTAAQMAAMESSAGPIIHANDTNALVISPGYGISDSSGMLNKFEQYLAAGGGTYSDVIACHLYDNTPEDDIQCVPSIKSLLSAYSLGSKPIWNTETGWGFAGVGTNFGQQPMSTTSAFAAREFVLNWALGLSNCNWYNYSRTGNMGVRQDTDGNWTVLTAASTAYQQVEGWLNGATMTSCAQDSNGNWVARITKSGGYVGYIVWNADRAFSYPKPVGVTQMQELTGNVTSLTAATNVSVNATPLLLDH